VSGCISYKLALKIFEMHSLIFWLNTQKHSNCLDFGKRVWKYETAIDSCILAGGRTALFSSASFAVNHEFTRLNIRENLKRQNVYITSNSVSIDIYALYN
jgi:hypothetical protein